MTEGFDVEDGMGPSQDTSVHPEILQDHFLSLILIMFAVLTLLSVWTSCLKVSPESGPSRPDAENIIKSGTGLIIPLLDHRLWGTYRVHECVVVLRVAALVLVDFPPDLFGCVLVIVLLISGHRLQVQWKKYFCLLYHWFCCNCYLCTSFRSGSTVTWAKTNVGYTVCINLWAAENRFDDKYETSIKNGPSYCSSATNRRQESRKNLPAQQLQQRTR